MGDEHEGSVVLIAVLEDEEEEDASRSQDMGILSQKLSVLFDYRDRLLKFLNLPPPPSMNAHGRVEI